MNDPPASTLLVLVLQEYTSIMPDSGGKGIGGSRPALATREPIATATEAFDSVEFFFYIAF